MKSKAFFRGTSFRDQSDHENSPFNRNSLLYRMSCGWSIYCLFLHSGGNAPDPLKVVSKFMIIAWIIDLVLKYLWQEIPTQNIKPFLTMNIRKNTLVNYMLAKTFLSAFSWLSSLFFITFSLIALFNGYSIP